MLLAAPPPPQAAIRHLRSILSFQVSFLLHCRDVLLNGRYLHYRLWSVAVGAFPTVLWTVCFKQVKRIPDSFRPPIEIHILPALNELLLSPPGLVLFTLSLVPLAHHVYSPRSWEKNEERSAEEITRARAFAVSIPLFPAALALLDRLGQATISPTLDLVAFGSYGALHFASPIILGWWCWGFGSQGSAATFGWCLGLQNLCGLATHLILPNAAPWFYDLYGKDAAQPDYSYPGNPAGLYRVDEILGTHIYTNAFGKSPVVFGAIPSLHAATSICAGLFIARYSNNLRGLVFMWIYCSWMFWATMYLHHHFAIDLVLGTVYAAIAFFVSERIRLRKIDLESDRRGLTNGWQRLRWGAVDGGFVALQGSPAMRRSSSGSSLGSLEGNDYSLPIAVDEDDQRSWKGEWSEGEEKV